MSYEEDNINEEDEIEEGRCDECSEHIIGHGLTKCPESDEEVEHHCLVAHSFCRDCCKNALEIIEIVKAVVERILLKYTENQDSQKYVILKN